MAAGCEAASFNYVRNSVKAVVDAYDGSVKFYVIDDKDPIIKAYREAFPRLFTLRATRCPRSCGPTSGIRRICSPRRPACGASTT